MTHAQLSGFGVTRGCSRRMPWRPLRSVGLPPRVCCRRISSHKTFDCNRTDPHSRQGRLVQHAKSQQIQTTVKVFCTPGSTVWWSRWASVTTVSTRICMAVWFLVLGVCCVTVHVLQGMLPVAVPVLVAVLASTGMASPPFPHSKAAIRLFVVTEDFYLQAACCWSPCLPQWHSFVCGGFAGTGWLRLW